MIASWMLYCALCAVGLSLAAALAERALLAGRGAVRHVWVAAIALSFVVPAVAYRFAPRPAPVAETATADLDLAADSVIRMARSTPGSVPIASTTPRTTLGTWRAWRATVEHADEPIAVIWMVLSMALSGYFLAGMMALAWLRRGWEEQSVLGVPVLVSEHTGPALLAGVSPAIVLPRWALAMESSRLSLMLRHEQEHQRARDGQLLFAAQFALIAMPWNVALWWQIMRLRVAVELDCDARVLRHTDARRYGDLLLEVVRPGRRSRFMVATAFAERATQLERRIRVMARRRDRASRGARLVAASIALATVTVAWISPRPVGPARAVTPRVVPGASQRDTALQESARPAVARVESATKVASTVAKAPPRVPLPVAQVATPTRDTMPPRPDTPLTQIGGRGGGRGGPLRDPAQVAEAVFGRLFDGIALTQDQATEIHSLLLQLAHEERAQADSALPAVLEFTTKRLAILARRDSSLMAIPLSDADRETLKSRFETPLGGGRRGGAPPNPAGGQPGTGRSGGGRGGRGGSPSGPVNFDTMLPQMIDLAFHRFFDGIALTPDQESEARSILTTAQTEQNGVRPPPPRRMILREVPVIPTSSPTAAVILMSEQGLSSLLSVLTNEADRAKVQSRVGFPALAPLAPRPPQ